MQRNTKKNIGADFIGVLDIHLTDYRVKKGFLAQSKLIERMDMKAQRNF